MGLSLINRGVTGSQILMVLEEAYQSSRIHRFFKAVA